VVQVNEHAFLLVLDQAWDDFAEASEAVERLCNSFARDDLEGIDLFAHPPATLACLVRFVSAETALESAPAVSTEARRGGWRMLDVSSLTKLELEHFSTRMLPRFAFRESNVADTRAALNRLLEDLAISSPLAAAPDRELEADTAMSVQFSSSQLMLGAVGRDLSREGVYIESGVLPQIGEELTIAIETGTGQGPCTLSARIKTVVDEDEAKRLGNKPGFFAEFCLQGDERNLLEAFLIAVARGRRWPEQSGRRFERFPVRLCAEYDYEGRRRIETTGNLSRGGVFLISANPPAMGSELRLTLSAPGQGSSIELSGVVVHVATPAAGQQRQDPGAGVRFIDSPDLVRARLAQLLGERGSPKTRSAMIVDDDRFFRTIFRGELERAGYSVMEAATGEDAFALLLTQLLRLDLLIVDMHMPGMSGEELLNRIAEVGRDPELAVAVVTGDEPQAAEMQRLQSLGADIVLTKRQSPDEIVGILASVLRRPQM
jgi:uncharacterized protein (TIGR02266 family)